MSAPAGWVCPACDRRVPTKVNACRCGYERSEAAADTEDDDEAPDEVRARRLRAVAEALALVTLIAGVGYYYFGPTKKTLSTNMNSARPPETVINNHAPMSAVAAAVAERSAPSPAPTAPPAAAAVTPAAAPALPPAAGPPATLEDVISNAMPALVRVETGSAFGSGFFVSADTVLTNVHVVAGNRFVTVKRADGSAVQAHVERTASAYDIAILKLPSPDPAQRLLTMGSGIRVRAGQEVVAIGTPLGLQNTVTRGIVSAVRLVGSVSLVQTDAAINPGNSGGPILDRTGQVVAIATMTVRPGVGQGLSFGVAIDHARALIDGQLAADSGAPSSGGLAQALGQSPSPSLPSSPGESASGTDATRERGRLDFEQTIGQLARVADSLDDRWRSFVKVCYRGQIAGAFDRPWFALYDARAMQGSIPNGCDAAFSEIRQTADRIRTEMRGADEAARRSDVYPGARREVLRRHRLEFLSP